MSVKLIPVSTDELEREFPWLKMQFLHKCLRCGYQWMGKEHPLVCAGCHSPRWDRERVVKRSKRWTGTRRNSTR